MRATDPAGLRTYGFLISNRLGFGFSVPSQNNSMSNGRPRDEAATFPPKKVSIFWHRIVALEEIFES
jgi:hypothetical protein